MNDDTVYRLSLRLPSGYGFSCDWSQFDQQGFANALQRLANCVYADEGLDAAIERAIEMAEAESKGGAD